VGLAPTGKRERADRRSCRNRQAVDRGRKGQALRPVGSVSADDPPCARGVAGCCSPERIFLVVAQVGKGNPTRTRRVWNRTCPSVPWAKAFLPGSSTRRPSSTLPTTAVTCFCLSEENRMANRPLAEVLEQSPTRRRSPALRSPSPGSSPKSPGSCRSLERQSFIASKKTRAQPM
jgi:hypothetical protein